MALVAHEEGRGREIGDETGERDGVPAIAEDGRLAVGTGQAKGVQARPPRAPGQMVGRINFADWSVFKIIHGRRF